MRTRWRTPCLRVAISSFGAETRDTSATNNLSITANPWGMVVTGKATASANLASIANLRAMLNDDGIKGNGKALASIVRAIRQLQ